MKKQVLFIHGGQSYSNYEVFLKSLRDELLDPYAVKPQRWHQSLAEKLGEAYEVFHPSMPNSENAKYIEWKIWFEKYIPYLHDGVVLIGHSQGGYFLSKYFTENPFPVSIKALVLVAAPFEPDDFGGEDGGDFHFDTTSLQKLAEVADYVYLFHSEDDFVVPYRHALRYKELLPQAELITFKDKNHFLVPELPELIEQIKRLG